MAPLTDAIGRRDASLAKQLRAALSSAALNVAEGSDQRGARRTNHHAIALGSARESFVATRTAEAWGYLRPVPQGIVGMFNQVIGTLVRNVAARRVSGNAS